MIILDTNVLSEVLKPQPNKDVLAWMGRIAISRLFTTTITEAEIRFGVARLLDGQRKDALSTVIGGMFSVDFENRILPFDSPAAQAYALITASRDRIGRPISQLDAQIAAIAQSCGGEIATRNDGDFYECGVVIINPWELA